jgi:hypothetical protein
VTALDQFRPGADTAPATKKAAARKRTAWLPPTREDLGHGHLLAFDPSLSAMGFCALSHDLYDPLHVVDAGTLKGDAPPEFTGWEQTLRQALILEARLRDLLGRYSNQIWQVVHESPPLGGGRIRSPESAILASHALRSAALDRDFEVLPMVAPQAHRRATTGQATIKKSEHHALLMPLLYDLAPANLGVITNESRRDAISVAVTELVRRKR